MLPSPQSPEVQQRDAINRQLKSIAVQQASIERQRAAAGHSTRTLPSSLSFAQVSETPAGFDCDPAPPLVLERAVHDAAQAYNIEPNLIHAVIRQESAGYPCAVSAKGAMGLMQLMPDTAAEMGAAEPFDVSQNITAGTRFLAELMQRYNGDLNRVLGAYNAGPATVDRIGAAPLYPETTNYIRSIMERIKPPADPKLFAAPVR